MKIVNDIESFFSDTPCAVTIGKFDGVHRGHRELIRKTIEHAKKYTTEKGVRCRSVVFTFDMAPVMILSKEERRTLLKELGVDILIECAFTPKVITMTPEHFIENILVERLKAAAVVTGEDFRFGYGRAGDDRMLAEFGERDGFCLDVVPVVLYEEAKISSTRIREALLKGKMEDVTAMLGFPYFVRGSVIHGRQIGRTIGIPTANLIPDQSKMLPPNGVYYAESYFAGRWYRGISNIGTKPTVDGHFVGVETYFFDCSADLYDEVLEVRMCYFSRPERKFDSLAELTAQIHSDELGGREYFAKREND